MTRGEIWWAEDPQIGRRPVLILTRDSAIPVLRSLVVVPATRSIRDIPTHLALDEEDGMPTPCALSFDNLDTVPKAMLTQPICRLSGDRMVEACRALAIATGC